MKQKHIMMMVEFKPWMLLTLLIDSMLQWSIVWSVGPLHGPGSQRSHASAGQPDRPEGEDQLGPTTSHHLGPCCRRPFRRTRRTNQMCSIIRYAFGDDTIGSREFIAAVTRTAGPRPFGGEGLGMNQIQPVAGRA